MRFVLSCIALFTLFLVNAGAQELNCKVNINTPNIQTTDPKVFQTLKTSITEYLNSTTWTDGVYEPYEKIDVNITINIKEEVSTNIFKADMIIQATRPVFGSTYNTPIFSYSDKDFNFIYEQFQPIQYTKGVFNDNLSSMLSFYAFFVLGSDYDTFSSLGGENYFQTAQEIMNNIPASVSNNYAGWKSSDGARSRYFVMENALNPGMKAIRQGMYEYHRKGLDLMSTNQEAGREGMQRGLEYCEAVNKSYPNSTAIQLLASTKSDEIISVFRAGDANQRAKITQIMTKLDPAGAQKYAQLAF